MQVFCAGYNDPSMIIANKGISILDPKVLEMLSCVGSRFQPFSKLGKTVSGTLSETSREQTFG